MPVRFSVIIPLYNKCLSIERAVHSVLGQRCRDFELIIVDDGSTDNSARLVEQISHPSIRLIRQANAGVSAARNAAIFNSRGDYIAMLDADDVYKPDFLNEIDRLIHRYPQAGMYCTGYEFLYPDGQVKAANINRTARQPDQLISDYFEVCARGDLLVSTSSVCIPKGILESIGGFPENENMGEDQSVWSQIALRYPTAYSNRILSQYFQDTQNRLMKTVDVETELPYSCRLQQCLDNGKVPIELRSSIRLYIAGHLLDLVRRNFIANRFDRCGLLLADPRIRKLRMRWLYWLVRVQAACLRHG